MYSTIYTIQYLPCMKDKVALENWFFIFIQGETGYLHILLKYACGDMVACTRQQSKQKWNPIFKYNFAFLKGQVMYCTTIVLLYFFLYNP